MDILCTRCGEPWDVCSLADDMSLKEANNLKAGKGCPCCTNIDSADLHPINDDARYIQRELASVLGDDIDGLAATMEDFNLI